MSKILELREKRAKAWEAAKAFLDAKRTQEGFVSAEDAATYDKMENDVVNLGKEIERLERQAAIDAELSKATSTPITNKPDAKTGGDTKTGRATDEYRKAFWNGMRNKVLSYEVQNALTIGTDSEGGYLVPDEYEKKLVEALEEEAFFIGDGKGKPTGIFNATGGAETGVTSTGTSITFDDVMDLYYSLRAPYRNKAVWLLNDSTVKAIRKLKDGNGNYIWQPSVREGEPDKILNRPYRTSIYVPELAAGNRVMAFGDYSYYWIADRQGRSFKRLNELYATTGQVGFLASERVDGKLILSEAVKTLDIKAAGK